MDPLHGACAVLQMVGVAGDRLPIPGSSGRVDATSPSSRHPSSRRRLGFGLLIATLLSACSDSDVTAAMPPGDHVHALQEVADGSLLLGLHGALYRSQDAGSSWELAGLEGL